MDYEPNESTNANDIEDLYAPAQSIPETLQGGTSQTHGTY